MNRIEITATITADTTYSVSDVQGRAAGELTAALRDRFADNGVRVVSVTVGNVQAVAAPAVDLGTLSERERQAAEAAVRALRS